MIVNVGKMPNPVSTGRSPELRGYTGRIFEWEVLGQCTVHAHGYMKYWDAVQEVMDHQAQNPVRPMGETSRFYDAVASELRNRGLNPAQLKVYSAVGSTLDRYHGVDGFFAFQGIVVTVDCTISPHKDETKARVLVTAEDAFAGYPSAAFEIAGWIKSAWVKRLEVALIRKTEARRAEHRNRRQRRFAWWQQRQRQKQGGGRYK